MIDFLGRGFRKLKNAFIPHNLKYKPTGVNQNKIGVAYKEIYPTFQSVLTFQNDLYLACPDYIITPKEVEVPAAQVVEVVDGRIYATFAYIAIVDKNNHIVPEVCYHHVSINQTGEAKDNPIFRTQYFIAPTYYKGVVFTLLSGGGAATNYGHWLIDAIPRVGLLKKSGMFDEVDWFVVPNYTYDYHRESLSLLGIPLKKIIVAKSITHIKADKIIASTSPRHVGHFPVWVGQFLRDSFFSTIKKEVYPPYAYIRRSDSSIRRILNEDELVERLPKGFVTYELSKLSFTEKVNLFRSVDFVVSATGAGLSNIVFCKPQTKVLEIFNSTFISTMFADIATKVGVDYYYLIKDAGKKAKRVKEGEVDHFTVDIDNALHKIEGIMNLI